MESAPLLHDALAGAADAEPDRIALLDGDRTWTTGALDASARSWAGVLAERGVGPGDRVALLVGNRPEFVVAVHALSRVGAAAVLLSPAWKPRELGHACALTAPVAGLADGEGRERLAAVLGPDRVLDLDAGALPRLGTHHGPDPDGVEAVAVDADADVVLVFSSGTTGMPKAVRHTHRSMGQATADWVGALGLGPDDRFQVATPPSHILGLLNLLAAIAAGATVRLHRRFDLDAELAAIEADRLTLEMAVAPIALAMANHPDLERHDLSSLRYLMWGATPVTPSVAEAVTRRTGVGWLPGYGASEVPVIAVNPVDRPEARRLDAAGLPLATVDVRVVALDTGAVLPAGEVGELQLRSPSTMAGYLPDEANDEAFVDGWYRTGDVGWLEPEGWVHLTDRAKEMIKVKGFQVAPAEIEAVLHGHPGVVDCAVFGVPDPLAGEVPVAAVELAPVGDAPPPTPEELEALVAAELATYKRLHHVVVVDEIPRLPSGKVLRRALRDEWTETR